MGIVYFINGFHQDRFSQVTSEIRNQTIFLYF